MILLRIFTLVALAFDIAAAMQRGRRMANNKRNRMTGRKQRNQAPTQTMQQQARNQPARNQLGMNTLQGMGRANRMSPALARAQAPIPSQSFTAPQTFGNITYASTKQKIDWYSYIGRVFWRAGFYRGLKRVYKVVRSMRVSPGNPDYASWMALLQKLDGRLRLAQPLMISSGITDRMAIDVTDILLNHGYPEARNRLKRLRLEGSLSMPSDDMKALTLAVGLIRFEAVYNRPIVPLWEFFWKLTLPHKMDVMTYANSVRKNRNAPLGSHIANGQAVYARLMLIMGTQDAEALIKSVKVDPVEAHLLRGYAAVMKGDYCAGIRHFNEGAKIAPPQNAAEINEKVRKWKSKCKETDATNTYSAFCQFGPGSEFPISDAAKGEGNARTVYNTERLYWTAIWSGDCRVAFEQMDQLKRLVGQNLLVSHPTVNTRVAYMEQTLTECNANNRGTFDTAAGQQVLAALRADNPDEALRVAKEAKDHMLKFAALVFRFPKAAYSPCMGGAVISGLADIPTLELAHRITKGQILPECGAGNDKCHYRQLQAFYITGSLTDAKRLAKMMSTRSNYCKPTVQMLGCLELCSDPNNKFNLNKAVKHFDKLLETSQAQPAIKIAKQLAERLRDAPFTSGTLFNPQLDRVDQSHPGEILPRAAMKAPAEIQKQDIPLPSIKQRAPKLGSCPPEPGRTPCGCQAQPPPCQQVAPPVPVPQAPKQTPVQPAVQAPTPACNCSPGSATAPASQIPNNPTTGKPWTPEEVADTNIKEQQKREAEALKIAQPLIAKKLAEICEKQEQQTNAVLENMKKQLACPDCVQAKEEATRIQAIALADGNTVAPKRDTPTPAPVSTPAAK